MNNYLVPSRKVREEFILEYELKGAQRAVDFLTKHYGIRRMRVVLDGRRVGNGDYACYFGNIAYFTKEGLDKRSVLHELYHHIVNVKNLDMPVRIEEKDARSYAREFLRNCY